MQTSLIKKDSENKNSGNTQGQGADKDKSFFSFKTNKSGLSKPRLETRFKPVEYGDSLRTNLNFPEQKSERIFLRQYR